MKPYNKYQLNYGGNIYAPCLLINEYLFMTLARDLSFAVPYNAIIKGENDYHYIIKRFDRFNGIKFDHEEFATLLGLNTDTKYDATITEVLEKSKQYLSAKKDFLVLAKRLDIENFEQEMLRICRYFIDNFKSYIEKLPIDIQDIPITQSKYNNVKSFQFILSKYYENRCKYIQEKIDADLFSTKNIWQ